MTDFKLAQYEHRLKELKRRTDEFLRNSGHKELAENMNSEINNLSDRDNLRLAFVGQYNSGKSTIISALTGNKEITIDANVATDVVSEYKWNNIVLLDTPGILAGKVEEHDLRTKEALKNSDLIFYVLTSQLFDNVIFNNFIDLAYNQHLADKIFIIINKMGMEDGDYNELVENYMISLKAIFAERGYDITKFPIAFIDAADYLEGVEDDDEEFVQLSHFEKFINMLNSFVERKGLIKKQFDSPIRLMQSTVQSVAVSQVDPAMFEFYCQFETRLNRSQREMKRDIANTLYSFNSGCMVEVVETSHKIGEVNESDWNTANNELNNSLKHKITILSSDIETVINDNYARLIEEMQEFGNKDSIARYSQTIETKLSQPNISIEERTNFETQKRILGWLKDGAKMVSDAIPGIDSVFSGISKASGSELHKLVKNIGHFFGKKFKPWEAVGMASKIGKVAKFGIPLAATVFDIVMADRERRQEEKIIRQINEARNKFITSYQSEINNVVERMEKEVGLVYDNYNLKRDELAKSKAELLQTIKHNERIEKRIEELEGEYVDFIEIIDGAES